MSNCTDRFQELTHHVDIVLDEDLQALGRMSERARVERYNTLKASEEEFVWEFSEECPDFLTESERARVRGRFRLARLLMAASFYREDKDMPQAMASDFVDAELTAVVEFDRYRQFDALSESQIEEKIRRMEGEVYELVEEYTSTQLVNIEQLIEHPEVQQDLIEQLLGRYEERREKIRRGFFTYVETHGLEHMVETIESAVKAVTDASAEREAVHRELTDELASNATDRTTEFQTTRHQIESELRQLEHRLASGTADTEELQERLTELSGDALPGESAVSEIETHIDRATELDTRLEGQLRNLQDLRDQTTAKSDDETAKTASELISDELEQLQEEREAVQTALDQLKREREQIDAAQESLDSKQEALEDQVERVRESVGTAGDGIEGSNAVTAEMAKLLEMNYLGRFDISMHEATEVQMQDEAFGVPDGYWESRSERRNNRAYLLSILDTDHPDAYPLNGTARYEITSSGALGFGQKTEMVIEASVVSDLDAYVANGFDTAPADLDTLLAVINEVVAEAENGEYTYLVGLASPTGWSERVREQVQHDEFAKTRYSRHVSICLINLQDGSLIYDESDAVASENADLFAPPVDAEHVEDCIETVRTEYVDDFGHESVLLQDVVEAHGYNSQVVKRAFNRLEDEGAGEQLYLDDLGVSLNVGA